MSDELTEGEVRIVKIVGTATGMLCPDCGNGVWLCAARGHKRIAELEAENEKFAKDYVAIQDAMDQMAKRMKR